MSYGQASEVPSSPDDDPQEEINVQEWLNKILKARQKEQNWRERAKKCIKVYRDETNSESTSYSSPRDSNDNESPFNILWANVETLQPALFSNIPKPDVRNRYLNSDPTAETAGRVIERTLSYSLDAYNFAQRMKSAVKDYLLTGRSIVRVRLIPEFEDVTTYALDEYGNQVPQTEEKMTGQSVQCELVDYDAFVLEPVSNWDDVTWIAFIHMLTKSQFMSYFKGVPLVAASKEKDKYSTETRYKVYEVWDKNTKKVLFLGDAEKPLKVMDDPFDISNFWPIPEPLYSIKTNDTMVPIPEYVIYQAQAYELNEVSYRITDLVNCCKFIGVYDSQQSGLSDLLKGRDSQFFPVTANLLRDGGIKSVVDSIDNTKISNVLAQLYHQRDQIKAVIYEVTGISDIIRGDSQASETATAQNIKARYAGLRLRDRRDSIDRFVVELLRIKAELICKFFTTEQMQAMSGIMITPDVEQVIRGDVLRSYKIDIETDSTILADMQVEAQNRAALVASITQFIASVSPLVAQGAMPMETAKALLNFALGATKITRELEDAIDLIGQPQQPPPQMQPPQQPQGMPGQMPHGMPSHTIPGHGAPHPVMPHAGNQLPPGLSSLNQNPPGLQQ